MARRSKLKHENHDSLRAAMRIVGPLLILVGAGMFVTGIISFNQSFDEGPRFADNPFVEGFAKEERSPDRFWMCFVGMPIAMLGFVLTRFGFLGAAARYVAAETAPVASDAINYVAHGTKGSIREVARAIRDDSGGGSVACPSCDAANDEGANFCSACGNALARACPSCDEQNDAKAKYCDACGAALDA